MGAAHHCVPTPDGGGGALIEVPAGTTHCKVNGVNLRAVDVLADSTLRTLDLTGCHPAIHVSFVTPVHLERLRLPASGSGAVVHLPLAGCDLPVFITGSIDVIDAAWPGTDGARRTFDVSLRQHDTPATGAYIGPASGVRLAAIVDDGLVALIRGNAAASELNDLASRSRHVVIDSCLLTDGLRTEGELHTIEVRDSLIAGLAVDASHHVRIEGCRGLRQVEGHIKQLTLRDCERVDTLRIEGYVSAADIAGVACDQLIIPTVQELNIQDGGEIGTIITLSDHTGPARRPRIRVRGRHAPKIEGSSQADVQPLTADDIYDTFVNGTEAGRQGMLRWARNCKPASQLWLALRVMAMAVDAGEPADEIWQDRCELARRKKAGDTWKWRFPPDLAARGWTADVRLWLRCVAKRAPSAVVFGKTMAAAHHPQPIAALLLTAAGDDVAPPERGLLLELCRRALAEATDKGERLDRIRQRRRGPAMSLGLTREDQTWLWHGVRALTRLADHRDALRVADQMAAWVATCAPTTDGVRVVGRLAAHGSTVARQQLLGLRSRLARRTDIDQDMRVEIARTIAHQLVQPTLLPTFSAPAPADSTPLAEEAHE